MDWVFVGFPKAPPTHQDLDNSPLTFEPLRPQPPRPEPKPKSPIQLADLSVNPVPPPLPPRSHKPISRPPRPVSLYASLSPVVHPTDEYAQIIRSNRKRPKSNEMPPPMGDPPPLPPHFTSPPPIPRHLHGSGIALPLPESPPAPPLPPHATPSPLMHPDEDEPPPLPARNTSNTGTRPKSSGGEIVGETEKVPKFDESWNRSLYSPFYRRPLSIANSSLARSLSSSHLNPGLSSLEVFPRWMQDNRSYASVHVGSSSLELGESLMVQSNRCSFIATGFSNRVACPG